MKTEPLSINVTRHQNRWLVVLLNNGVEESRAMCALKRDIGWVSRELLRWFVKLGGVSAFASAARKRQTAGPVGKVWHGVDAEGLRKVVAATDNILRNTTLCPRDTNGDGDCGRRLCPVCGEQKSNFGV